MKIVLISLSILQKQILCVPQLLTLINNVT